MNAHPDRCELSGALGLMFFAFSTSICTHKGSPNSSELAPNSLENGCELMPSGAPSPAHRNQDMGCCVGHISSSSGVPVTPRAMHALTRSFTRASFLLQTLPCRPHSRQGTGSPTTRTPTRSQQCVPCAWFDVLCRFARHLRASAFLHTGVM